MSKTVTFQSFYGYNMATNATNMWQYSTTTVASTVPSLLVDTGLVFACDIHGPLSGEGISLNGVPLCSQCLLAAFGGRSVAELEGEANAEKEQGAGH